MNHSREEKIQLKKLHWLIYRITDLASIICFIYLWPQFSFGAIQNISISGSAYKVELDSSSGYYTVYAGYNGSSACATRDNTSTCNSCLNQNSLVPCNPTMIYPELKVRIAFQSTATGNNLQVAAKTTSGVLSSTDFYSYSSGAIVSGGEAYIELTWSKICEKVFGLDSSCGGAETTAFSKTGTLTLGLSASADASSLAESFNVNFVFNFVPQSPSGATFTRCDPGSTLTGKVGVCSYSMFPGDGKAYIESVLLDTTSGGIDVTDHGKLGGMAILYVPTSSKTDPSPLTTITSSSPMTILKVTSSGTSSTSGGTAGTGSTSTTTGTATSNAVEFERDYITDGLSNGTTYCFLVGNVDNTGNVFNFMDPTMINFANAPNYCVTPQEVVGLLDGKSCFIATAAFGSPMSKEVQSLRYFRDLFLLQNSMGKALVKLYYKFSPPLANYIGKRDNLRLVVRGLLWPFVFFAKMSLQYGLFWATFLFLTVFSIIVILFKTFVRRLQLFLKISLFLFFVLMGVGYSNKSIAQTAAADGISQDGPPNEAPYVDTTKEFAPTFDSLPKTTEPNGGNTSESSSEVRTKPVSTSTLTESPLSTKSESTSNSSEASSANEKPFAGDVETKSAITNSKKDVDYIKHPLTKRGLEVIEADGTYVYKIKEKTYTKSSTFRIGLMDPPAITGPDGSSFADHYSKDRVPMFLYDYEWQPFVGKGKLGVQVGFGLFMTHGSGRFYPIADTLIPKEKFTFYGLPINAGVIYRLEIGSRQWLAPYVSGGGSYYLLVETRNDKSTPKFAQSPSAYMGGGLLLSVSRVDSKVRFAMLNDYGIGNLWLNFEFRYQQGLNSDVDLSGSLIAFGVQADY